jgi:hypothetical protein
VTPSRSIPYAWEGRRGPGARQPGQVVNHRVADLRWCVIRPALKAAGPQVDLRTYDRGHTNASALTDLRTTRWRSHTAWSTSWSLLVQQPTVEPGALEQTPNGRRRLSYAEPDACFLGGSARDQHGSQS